MSSGGPKGDSPAYSRLLRLLPPRAPGLCFAPPDTTSPRYAEAIERLNEDMAVQDNDGQRHDWLVLAMALKGHSQWAYSVAFSPDGRRLASIGGDRMVKLWDTASGQEHCTFKGHTDDGYAVAFSPDGHWIASGAKDKPVILWDGRPLADEIAVEREALAFVRFLVQRETRKPDALVPEYSSWPIFQFSSTHSQSLP